MKPQAKIDPEVDFTFLEQQPHLIDQTIEAAKQDVLDAKAALKDANTRLNWLKRWSSLRYGT